MIYTESYSNQTLENFFETLHFYSDSQVRALYIGENSGPSLLKITPTWSSSANLGNLVIVYPPDPVFLKMATVQVHIHIF